MRIAIRRAAKRLFYPLYHRLNNSDTLTVAMFHRVLKRNDPRWASALPDWTVSDDIFEQCLRFFGRHYNVVQLSDVIASYRGERPLPKRSLLITFDDGYADNEEYALPLLRRYGLPAVVFVFSDALNSAARPWPEDLVSAHSRDEVSFDELVAVHRALYGDTYAPPPDAGVLITRILDRGPRVEASEVEAILSRLQKPLERVMTPAQMLSTAQLRRLHAEQVSIGAHGKTHSALPDVPDLDEELLHPRGVIARMLEIEPDRATTALAFPYGSYDRRVVEQAKRQGYELLFTTIPALVPLSKGRLTTPLLGRVNVHGPTIAPDGQLRMEQLAYIFFRTRPAIPPSAS